MDVERLQFRRTKEALDAALNHHQQELDKHVRDKLSAQAENEFLVAERKDVKDRFALEDQIRKMNAEKESIAGELRIKLSMLQRCTDERDLVKEELKIRGREIELLKSAVEFKEGVLDLSKWFSELNAPWHLGWEAIQDYLREERGRLGFREKGLSLQGAKLAAHTSVEEYLNTWEMEYVATCGVDKHLETSRYDSCNATLTNTVEQHGIDAGFRRLCSDGRIYFVPKDAAVDPAKEHGKRS
eukprot:gene21588-25966_t